MPAFLPGAFAVGRIVLTGGTSSFLPVECARRCTAENLSGHSECLKRARDRANADADATNPLPLDPLNRLVYGTGEPGRGAEWLREWNEWWLARFIWHARNSDLEHCMSLRDAAVSNAALEAVATRTAVPVAIQLTESECLSQGYTPGQCDQASDTQRSFRRESRDGVPYTRLGAFNIPSASALGSIWVCLCIDLREGEVTVRRPRDRSVPTPGAPAITRIVDSPTSQLRIAAESARVRALNALERADAAMRRFDSGSSPPAEAMAIEGILARYFPRANTGNLATIRGAIGEALEFLRRATIHGVYSAADLAALPNDSARSHARSQMELDADTPASTQRVEDRIFVYRTYTGENSTGWVRSAAERAAIMVHEAFHGVLGPSSGTPGIDHGPGALDNAFNYEGLVIEINQALDPSALPVSGRLWANLEAQTSSSL